MPKSPRMAQIEAMLADDPADQTLQYMLAMEHTSVGDDPAAVGVFRALMATARPYVPAYLMAAQALGRLGRETEAAAVLRDGIAAARAEGTGDALHALGEMQGLLATIE